MSGSSKQTKAGVENPAKLKTEPLFRKRNAQADAMAPQASIQTLLSPEERAFHRKADEEERSMVVSYMMRETQKLSKDDFDGMESCSRRRGSWTSLLEASPEVLKGSSKIRMYEHEQVDSSRMVDIIQRELKVLMEAAPPVVLLASALSDAICHYKECDRCSEKISPSLPWILNRIQKLIKYVTTQRQGNYSWPNDYSYLRLRPTDQTPPPQILQPLSRPLAKLEKLDPLLVVEDNPGLQLLLEVKPDTTKKKFFERAENRSAAPWDSFLNFSVVQLREPQSLPLIQVLVPSDHPAPLLDEKREVVLLKESACAHHLLFVFCVNHLVSLRLRTPVGRLTKTRRPEFPQHHKAPYRTPSQERSVHPTKKNPKGLQQGPYKAGEKTVHQSKGPPKRSNVKEPLSSRNLLARVPEIVREFLQEAETERMHDQKVRSLEAGAKGLRDLMTEVQRNQMELSKVLMEKGLYPQPIIKLTDPELLDKENEVIRKVAALKDSSSDSVFVESLQATMDELKHKCALKNRMILIILKGLRSDIPKEWWEDMVDYVFDKSQPIEDFDTEKVSEMVRQASNFSGKGVEQASRLQAWALRSEEQPSEEEPNMRGIVGADVEEKLKKRWKHGGALAKTKDVTLLRDPEGFCEGTAAAAANENPSGVGTSIRKLEEQVALVNTENERLRHEVEDLKNLLRSSMDDLWDRRVSRADSDQRPSPRAPAKTINLTIQIMDKDFRINDVTKMSNISVVDGTRSPAIKYGDPSTHLRESEGREGNNLGHVPTVLSGSEELEVEWSSSDYSHSMMREKASGQGCHQVDSSGQEVFRNVKPITWVPSKYRIPEVSDGRGAGPSRKPVDAGHLLQKPSLMELAGSQSRGMLAWMANERELQTIPENDCSLSSNSSKGISQAIQRLRARVRSIHKDVAVLKSKNDRIDKLLDRLMDDAVENSESFEEMENNFHRLKDQLG